MEKALECVRIELISRKKISKYMIYYIIIVIYVVLGKLNHNYG